MKKIILTEEFKKRMRALAGLYEGFEQTNHHETGSSTSAANDLILYMVNTPLCLEFARKVGTSNEALKNVFSFVVTQYKREIKENPFELYADDQDGSGDYETVMYDFMAHYPMYAVNPGKK